VIFMTNYYQNDHESDYYSTPEDREASKVVIYQPISFGESIAFFLEKIAVLAILFLGIACFFNIDISKSIEESTGITRDQQKNAIKVFYELVKDLVIAHYFAFLIYGTMVYNLGLSYYTRFLNVFTEPTKKEKMKWFKNKKSFSLYSTNNSISEEKKKDKSIDKNTVSNLKKTDVQNKDVVLNKEIGINEKLGVPKEKFFSITAYSAYSFAFLFLYFLYFVYIGFSSLKKAVKHTFNVDLLDINQVIARSGDYVSENVNFSQIFISDDGYLSILFYLVAWVSIVIGYLSYLLNYKFKLDQIEYVKNLTNLGISDSRDYRYWSIFHEVIYMPILKKTRRDNVVFREDDGWFSDTMNRQSWGAVQEYNELYYRDLYDYRNTNLTIFTNLIWPWFRCQIGLIFEFFYMLYTGLYVSIIIILSLIDTLINFLMQTLFSTFCILGSLLHLNTRGILSIEQFFVIIVLLVAYKIIKESLKIPFINKYNPVSLFKTLLDKLFNIRKLLYRFALRNPIRKFVLYLIAIVINIVFIIYNLGDLYVFQGYVESIDSYCPSTMVEPLNAFLYNWFNFLAALYILVFRFQGNLIYLGRIMFGLEKFSYTLYRVRREQEIAYQKRKAEVLGKK